MDFEAIWNGDAYRGFRSSFIQGVVPQMCKGCDFMNQRRLEYLSVPDIGLKALKKDKRC